jgi:Holliday junction DNA helicase RuvA
MIGSLRGTLLERSVSGEALVEVAGIGYRVHVAPRTLASLGDAGGDVFLYIHHVVRDDALTLYGFLDRDERSCFEALIGAHGVGPALALAVLGVHAPDMLRLAVATGDLDALCIVPGIGKKTAARLVMELKDRLVTGGDVGAVVTVDVTGARSASPEATITADVREALAGLGYGGEEIREVLRDLSPDGQNSAALLREALQRLGAGR